MAVKVQYPGVAGAVRADLQNLDMIMRLLKRMAPGLDVKAITEEIRERIDEELDYELEAQNQRSLARIFAGHPFIFVPEVVSSLSRERVLVSEFVSGVGFEELKQRAQAERDRIGEIVFRFFLGCLYRHRQFSGDPHPGNFMLLDDGRVAFLDFGLFKRMDAEPPVELELAAQRAVVEGDARDRCTAARRAASCRNPSAYDPEHLLAVHHGRDLVVHDGRRGRPADAGDRDPGDDRELRPALAATSARCATRTCRPSTSSGGAWRCSRSPCCRQLRARGQLAPDRARVDLRRRARHRAGRARPSSTGALRRRLTAAGLTAPATRLASRRLDLHQARRPGPPAWAARR